MAEGSRGALMCYNSMTRLLHMQYSQETMRRRSVLTGNITVRGVVVSTDGVNMSAVT